MNTAQAVAAGIAFLSFVLALLMAAILLALVMRRRRHEAAETERQAQQLAASDYLAANLGGAAVPCDPALAPAAVRAALSHLLRLVRGEDRTRLLEVAERDGLFDDAVAALRHRRAERRIDAIHLLEQFASPDCVRRLHACLAADRSDAVRLEAAAALARLEQLPSPRALIEALRLGDGRPSRVHAALFRSLAGHHPDELAALAADDDHRALRSLLVEALGRTADLDMSRRLAVHAADPDIEVRAAAVRAALHLGHPAAAEWIEALLDDPAEAVRVQAAQACGRLGVREAVPALERLAADPAWWVRTSARTALDQLRPDKRTTFTLVGPAA